MNTQNIATWEKRLINLIIDSIIIQFIYLLFILIIGVTIISKKDSFEQSAIIEFNNTLYFLILYVFYYFILEGLLGRTIGKYVTRTKVISDLGAKPSLGKVLIRSIVRLFFVEVFSFFSSKPVGWHDRISGTKVVVAKK